jgi:hypothetical protein
VKACALAEGDCVETYVHGAASETTDYPVGGLILSDGATASSNLRLVMIYPDDSARSMYIDKWSGTFQNVSTNQAFDRTYAMHDGGMPLIRFRRGTGDTFHCEISRSAGVHWVEIGTHDLSGQSHVGLGATMWGESGTGHFAYEYLRVYRA